MTIIVFVTVVLATAATAMLPATCCVSAFSTVRSSCCDVQGHRRLRLQTTTLITRRDMNTRLRSNNNNKEDDELSKLIGKRDSIRRKKSESDLPPEPILGIWNITLPPGGMQVFDMPDFKTKRPHREAPPSKDDKEKAVRKQDRFIDYQADHDDENDSLHILNRIGFGTMAWGDPSLGFKAGTKKLKKKETNMGMFVVSSLQSVYNKLMESGVTFLDTSENYGVVGRKAGLSAEHIIGRCVEENNDYTPVIASTLSNPWRSLMQGTGLRFGRKSVVKAIEASCERLGTSCIDLYQIPSKMLYPGLPGAVMNGLCMALDQGLINNVGVCNMRKRSMKRFQQRLEKRGYGLTSNQFEFSLVNRKAYKSGLIKACKDRGVIPLARNPLGGGLASGVYTATNPTGGQATKGGEQLFTFKVLDKYSALHNMIHTMKTRVSNRLEKENFENQDRYKRAFRGPEINADVTTTQIAINYVIAKGCVPIPSVTTSKEAQELLGCLGWALTEEEVQMLDTAADASDAGINV